jgi:hypothetical protein
VPPPASNHQGNPATRPGAVLAATSSPSGKTTNGNKRKTWAAPAFVVGNDTPESGVPKLAGGDLPLEDPRLSPDDDTTVQEECSSAAAAAKPPTREISPAPRRTRGPHFSPGAGTRKPVTSLKVGWNQDLFVVVDQEGDDDHQEQDQDEEDEDEYVVIQVPSRAALGFNKSAITKRDLLVVDQAMLRTRLEWSQLLASKALKPYRQMICAVDDDLPDPNDLEDMEEAASNEDYLGGKRELLKIRDEMLEDAGLNEKLVAAFFEGYTLFQMKVNSLQSQLDGMKAKQKVGLSQFSSMKSQRFIPNNSLPDVPQRNTSISDYKGNGGMFSESPTAPFEPLSVLNEDEKEAPARTSSPPQQSPAEEQKKPASTTTLKPPVSTSDDGSSRDVSGGKNTSPPSKRGSRTHISPRSTKGVVGFSRSIRQMSIQRIREATNGNEDIGKLLAELEEAERRQKKLEKQLAQAGVVIAEDIPYDVAKEKVISIARRMTEIGGSNVGDRKMQDEYYVLEQQMEKFMTALQLTDEWVTEQEELERRWEESITLGNEEAVKKLRRHIPVDVRNRSEAMLSSQPAPNGKYLPKSTAKKFKRTNVLQLLRIDPVDIVPMHAATLENLRVTGLTLTERRALHHHLKDVGLRWKTMQGDKMTERKWNWFNMMKSNFKENIDSWERHIDQYGPPGNHPYATHDNPDVGCPLLGKQCPLKADKMIDYEGDYGFPEGPEYFKSDFNNSELDDTSRAKRQAQEAIKEKKSEERNSALKHHYKGNIFQVSLSNGSCELMDEAMDNMEDVQEKWIKGRLTSNETPTDNSRKKEMTAFNDHLLNELKLAILQFAERSGMQLTGKRDSNIDQPDIRSMVELSLCEEVIETSLDFFEGIEERMNEIRLKDGRMKVTIEQLRTLLEELQERNQHSIESLGQLPPSRSRELKSRTAITVSVKMALKQEEEAQTSKESPPYGPLDGTPGSGGRGQRSLLSAREGHDSRGKGPGPGRGGGGLMAAIVGRGHQR